MTLTDHGTTDHGLLFAEDFDLPQEPEQGQTPAPAADEPPEPEPVPLTEADIEAAWQRGHAAGLTEAALRDAALAATALTAIGTELGAARDALMAMAERDAATVARLLMEALAALLPDLCARHGEREAAAVMRLVLPALAYEPAVTVRVHPSIAPAIQQEIDRLTTDHVAPVILTPAASMVPGDVQVRWQDGRAVRDTTRICAALVAALIPDEPLPEAGPQAQAAAPPSPPADTAPPEAPLGAPKPGITAKETPSVALAPRTPLHVE